MVYKLRTKALFFFLKNRREITPATRMKDIEKNPMDIKCSKNFMP